jgi:hypothetical protein
VELLSQEYDPYVKVNLAMGLIGQQAHLEQAGQIVYQALNSESEKWIEKEEGIFTLLAPRSFDGEKDQTDASYVTPETENLMTRLSLLNALAIIDYSGTQEAVKKFLIEAKWGVSALASILLLTEGNEAAVDLVQQLLSDSNPKIRLQAALILSLWSREEKAIKVLENSYSEVDQETKVRILEGIGRIGSMHSIPFLIAKLKESSQNLRIVVALALIQCLNH